MTLYICIFTIYANMLDIVHVYGLMSKRVEDGSGTGTGTERGRAHPFEKICPPPRLSRKGG